MTCKEDGMTIAPSHLRARVEERHFGGRKWFFLGEEFLPFLEIVGEATHFNPECEGSMCL
jgi:hypothetical protein